MLFPPVLLPMHGPKTAEKWGMHWRFCFRQLKRDVDISRIWMFDVFLVKLYSLHNNNLFFAWTEGGGQKCPLPP
ncbi:hypothetical protein BSK33_13260 [Geobacillus sp. 44B]|nr:hypothetical protein BSK33_13260 [Geobacillus sp. 44B]